jgi:phosphatidylserine/phosphatidylglycerophosphate/cardiolipin synthase-like enzyme
MKKFFSAILLFAVLLPFSPAHATAAPIKSTGSIDVYFSPRGGATAAIVREIDGARREILIQAYSFTSKPIAQAIVKASKRGVKVVAVLDKSQRKERYTEADFLAHMRIPTFIDARHAIAHNKIIIIDRLTVLTGSFNFTKAAEEKNAENLLVIKGNKPLVNRYVQNFELHRAHSIRYGGK